MQFEWDFAKEKANIAKHGIRFAEAMTIFGDPFEVMIYDPDHSQEELRFLSIGMSSAGRLLVVAYTERSQRIRLISARAATTTERKHYESRNRPHN